LRRFTFEVTADAALRDIDTIMARVRPAALAERKGQIVPHFLLVCGDPSQPVGIIVMEAPSMLQAYTNAVTRVSPAG
jgi:hypothetical protein